MLLDPDPIADAEFVGLFMGEGHIDLCKAARGTSLCPRVRVTFRLDDLELLNWCKSRFGGSITFRPALRAATWQLTGKLAVAEVARVLDSARLPAKKRREVTLLMEAVALIAPRGARIDPAKSARLHAIKAEMIALRAYVEAAA